MLLTQVPQPAAYHSGKGFAAVNANTPIATAIASSKLLPVAVNAMEVLLE